MILLICILFFHANDGFSQLWKEYSDSAKIYSDQRVFDKAIEYYLNSISELKQDSGSTATYALACNNLANVYFNLHRFNLAEPLYFECLQIRANIWGKDHPNYASIAENIAKVYDLTGRYDKADSIYQGTMMIRLHFPGKDSIDFSNACNNYGILCIHMNNYEKAISLFIISKRIKGNAYGNQSIIYANSCTNLGGLYNDIGKYMEAESLYIEAINILQNNHKADRSYYNVSINLANLYQTKNDFIKAESLFIEINNILSGIFDKDSLDYANYYNNFGSYYLIRSKYNDAVKLFTDARRIWRNELGVENRHYTLACNNLGSAYYSLGQYELTDSLFMESKVILDKIKSKEPFSYAKTCGLLANLYQIYGQYYKALPLYLEAKKILENILPPGSPDYGAICNNIGTLYKDMGQYGKAEDLYQKSLEIKKNTVGTKNSTYASSLDNLGGLCFEMHNYAKAKEYFSEAKNIRDSIFGKEQPEYANSCNNLAALYNATEHFEEAESLYLEAREILSKNPGKEHLEYASNCNNLALVYTNERKFEKALPLYLEAKQICSKVLGVFNPVYALQCDNLGILYFDLSQFKEAESAFMEAIKIRDSVVGKEHPEYMQSCRNLAILYGEINNFNKALLYYQEAIRVQKSLIEKIFSFTSESEKLAYIIKASNLGKFYLSFAYDFDSRLNHELTYNSSLNFRNIVLSSFQRMNYMVNNTIDSVYKGKYYSWLDLRQRLAYWYSVPIMQRDFHVQHLEEFASKLEKELNQYSTEFKGNLFDQTVDWKMIQQNLNEKEASIEFIKFNYFGEKRWTDSTFYVAMVVRKDKSEPELVKLFEEKLLDTLRNADYLVTYENKINSLYKGNTKLYNLIWKPIEKHLRGISKIYFASTGELFKISLGALPISDTQVLSDKYQLVQLNTTATVLEQTQTFIASNDKIKLYGGIQYDIDSTLLKQRAIQNSADIVSSRSLPDDLTRGNEYHFLPGTLREVDAIQHIAENSIDSVKIVSGVEATEETVKALNGSYSPAVLHIATHGFFFPDSEKKENSVLNVEGSGDVFKQSDNPLFRSGLLLAGANNAWKGKPIDGVEDGILTAYEVSNMYLPNTKLVVLSACESALGDIQGSEGVYGLQRSFKIAGVQNLIMSLWKVPDTETAEFMQLFYKNLFEHQSVEDAFYQTQTIMKGKYRNEPYKWASWILTR